MKIIEEDKKVSTIEVASDSGLQLSSDNPTIKHTGSGTLTLETGHKLFVTAGTEGIFIGSGSSAIPINIGTTGSSIKIKGANYNTGGGGGGPTDTDDLPQGTVNLYFSNTLAVAAATGHFTSTDVLAQGTANLYFTNAKAVAAATGHFTSTDVLAQGTANLYFTNAKAVAAVTGNLSAVTGLLDSDDIVQGVNNLYFTNAKAVAAIIANGGVTGGNALTFGPPANTLTLNAGDIVIENTSAADPLNPHGIYLHTTGSDNITAIYLQSESGGIEVTAMRNLSMHTSQGGLTAFHIQTITAGDVVVESGRAVYVLGADDSASAITLTASDIAGGIDINAGTGGVSIETSGVSNFSTSGTKLTLEATGAGGEVEINAASSGAGLVDINAGSGGVAIDSTGGSVHIGGGAASEFLTAGTLTLQAGTNLILNGGVIGNVQTLVNETTAISLTTLSSVISTTAAVAKAMAIASGAPGQIKHIHCPAADAGGTVTVTGKFNTDGNTITFATKSSITLLYVDTTVGWAVISNTTGAVVSTAT